VIRLFARPRLDGILVLVLAVTAYLGAVSGTKFVQDDVPLVAENPRLLVSDAAALKVLVCERYWDRRRPHERLWRPIPVATLAIEHHLWGSNPDAFRRTNLVLHALASLIVWLLLRAHLPGRLALVGGLLFAVHPVHAEAVATVVGRCDVLALLFLALALYLHLAARSAGGAVASLVGYVLAAISFLLAFGSKEVALVGPVALIVLEVARRSDEERGWRRWISLAAPYLLYVGALGAYGAARWAVLQGELLPLPGAWALGRRPLDERVLIALSLARDAVLALALPLRTSGHFPIPTAHGGAPGLWAACLLHLGLGVVAFKGLASQDRLRRALGAGIVGTYLALGPTLNLVPIGVVRADRLLYGPSLFACLALVSGLGLALRGRANRRVGWTLALVALLVGSLPRLGSNAKAWTDPVRLWNETLERFPGLGRAHLELAQVYSRKVPLDDESRAVALEHLRLAVAAFEPRREMRAAAKARCALARLVAETEPSDAIRLYEEARAIDPSQLEAYQGLGAFYMQRSRTRSEEGKRLRDLRLAERVARKAANHVAPYAYVTWLQLGEVLSAMGQRDEEAEDALARALERSSDPWEAHLARGRLRERTRGAEAALADYQALLQLIRSRPEAQRSAVLGEALLGCVLGLRASGRSGEASPLAEELATRFPDSAAAGRLGD
jgi:tetratricopeptide (TPR) repeat protein